MNDTVNCRFLNRAAAMQSTVTDLDSLDITTLAQLLEMDSQQTLVLTVNNRHARRLLSELSDSLRDDRRVMPLPAIVPLAAWFRQAADQLSFLAQAGTPAHYLDVFAARGLWQQVIESVEGDDTLLDTSMAARLAAEADTLMSEWQLHVDPAAETHDFQRFALWQSRYAECLAERDAEDVNASIGRVCDAAATGELPLDFTTLVLAGFNELSPRMTTLLSALAHRGVHCLVLQGRRSSAGARMRYVLPDTDQEWWAAARWAKHRLQENPQGRYAIVASRLETDIALAHRVLRLTLPPAEGYNVAVARPLAQWPLVRAALAWLSVLADFRISGVSTPRQLGAALLAGACVGAHAEAAARARLDADWRHKSVIQISLPQFTGMLANVTPQLHQAWLGCVDVLMADRSRLGLHAWAAKFRDLLGRLGFPGQSPGSAAFQTLEAFDRALGQLGQYDVVWGEVSFAKAVGLLTRLVNETLFQPQRDPSARLDVLGLLEAEGGSWDGVWVLGLTDEILPAATRPNPLLPAHVLRHAGAPRATPERELQWAGVLFEDLCRLAPQVCFSHAEHEGERELRPSPFIAQTDEAAIPHYLQPSPLSVGIRLESVVDDLGPALQADAVVPGGISLIDYQSRNPLWAFVKYRLGASQLPDYGQLADQNARGLFMHRALELVWKRLGHQDALHDAVIQGQLISIVEEATAVAAQEYLAGYGDTLTRLEQGRGCAVVLQWLALEQARTPFAIEALEQPVVWQFGPLGLKLRLDRIDRMHDGSLAILDYKTGNGNIDPKANWSRLRLVDLQLPFYAAVMGAADNDAQVGALVLAQLHAKGCQVRGLADADVGVPGLASVSDWPALEGLDWSAVLARWRQAIEGLASDFIRGDARNRFEKKTDLDYCDVLPFLRLNEDGVANV
ncbi:PD-(D/E)XK nuclease family protein [Pusillimonas sp. T2]|uniref:PD-(D/E)XK nuclease family protein n=1 Tax=Pusillimonas sp. T2 TaxID=1548123 RepID=UPI0020B14987|nr:PD-(D/E)XK nuclease family protein [Pusillimonas sp. T2]